MSWKWTSKQVVHVAARLAHVAGVDEQQVARTEGVEGAGRRLLHRHLVHPDARAVARRQHRPQALRPRLDEGELHCAVQEAVADVEHGRRGVAAADLHHAPGPEVAHHRLQEDGVRV
jgi:hypothetical protein